MNAKKLVQEFYKSDVLIKSDLMETFLHPDFTLEWHSSKGFVKLNKSELLAYSKELEKAYLRSKVKMHQIFHDSNEVAVRYSHYVKTIENPREEMLLAHFFVTWQIKDDKLFKGYQMSQLA